MSAIAGVGRSAREFDTPYTVEDTETLRAFSAQEMSQILKGLP